MFRVLNHENFISEYNQKSINIALDGKFEDIHLQSKEEGIIVNLFDSANNSLTGNFVYNNHMSSPITIPNGYLFYKIDLPQKQKDITFQFNAQNYNSKDTTFTYNGFHILNIQLNSSKIKINDELKGAKTITEIDIEPYFNEPGQTKIFANADNEKIKNAWNLMDEVVKLEFNTHNEDIKNVLIEIKNSPILSFLYSEAKISYLIDEIERNKLLRTANDNKFLNCLNSKESQTSNTCNTLKMNFIESFNIEIKITNQLIFVCEILLNNRLAKTNGNYLYGVNALIEKHKTHIKALIELSKEINNF